MPQLFIISIQSVLTDPENVNWLTIPNLIGRNFPVITNKNPSKLYSILEYCKQIASYLILMYNFIFIVASQMEGLLVLRTPGYCSCFFMCSEVVSSSLRTWTDRHGSSNNAFVYLTGQTSFSIWYETETKGQCNLEKLQWGLSPKWFDVKCKLARSDG